MPKFVLVLAFVFGGIVATTGEAAAKIPVIYQTGQDAFECGSLPEPFDKQTDLAGFKAGYLCDITGVFWSYFSVRNCKPAAIKGDSYSDETELSAAIKAKYPESSMKRGIWNKYGWILLALLVAGGIAVWIKEKVTGED
jgi:ABC-type multidrug transport system permease subunit